MEKQCVQLECKAATLPILFIQESSNQFLETPIVSTELIQIQNQRQYVP